MKRPTKNWARAQADRLERLRDYPIQEKGRRQLARDIAKNFPTEADAKKAVTRMVEELDQCPTPATIRRYAEAAGLLTTAQDRLAEAASHQDCHECNNTGWKPIEVKRQDRVPDFCGCPVGIARKTGRVMPRVQDCGTCQGAGLVMSIVEVTETGVERCGCPVGRRMAGDSRIEPDQRGKQGNLL